MEPAQSRIEWRGQSLNLDSLVRSKKKGAPRRASLFPATRSYLESRGLAASVHGLSAWRSIYSARFLRMTFERAAESVPSIRGHYRAGPQAIRGVDRERIRCAKTRSLAGSIDIDIDGALKGHLPTTTLYWITESVSI